MGKNELLEEINEKIAHYEKRIIMVTNVPCWYSEDERIKSYLEQIQNLELVKEYLNRLD